MALSKRKIRESEELRTRVLDEAERIVVQEGVERVTMRRIAGAIEYAPTVLYRLFKNKEDLIDHLIGRGYEGVRRQYDEVFAQGDGDPMEVLSRLLLGYVNYGLVHPNHYLMWFSTGSLRLEEGKLVMRHGRKQFDVYGTWLAQIEACRGQGYFAGATALEVFQTLWARVHGLVSLRLQHPDFCWPPVAKHTADVLALPARFGGREDG